METEFNYKRMIMPEPNIRIPRIIFPLKLPRHSCQMVANNIARLEFLARRFSDRCVKTKFFPKRGEWAVIHRMF